MSKYDPEELEIIKHQGQYFEIDLDLNFPVSELQDLDPRSEDERVNDNCHDAGCSLRGPVPNE